MQVGVVVIRDGVVDHVGNVVDVDASGRDIRGDEDVFLAVPLLHGQLSCRELVAGDELARAVTALQPLTLDDLDNPYSRNEHLRETIAKRGLPRS